MSEKGENKQTFVENIEEAIKFEKELAFISNHAGNIVKLPHLKRTIRRIKGHPNRSKIRKKRVIWIWRVCNRLLKN